MQASEQAASVTPMWHTQAVAVSFVVAAGLAYLDLYEAENMENPVVVHAALLLAVAELGITLFKLGM